MGLLTLALILDMLFGDPKWLWQRLPHPVVLIGNLIDWADELRVSSAFRGLFGEGGNSPKSNIDLIAGVALTILLFALAIAVAKMVGIIGSAGWILELAIVTVLIAQKSLYDHVKAVAVAFRTGGLEAGRAAVSMIVGRDVSQLDESGVAKAGIESLAENFSDGVIAPVFWYAVAGLPGIVFYKAINTADSMIGHRNEQYEFFGKAAAKIDDWLNWPAARLTSFLIVIVILLNQGWQKARFVWAVTLRDATSHRSPNAGWPESSFAAALGLALGGPRRYANDKVDAEFLYGEGRMEATKDDIDNALRLFLTGCYLLTGLCGVAWFLG